VGVLEWVILVIVVAGIVIAVLGWDRYRGHQGQANGGALQPTSEVFIDPATGQQMRVWYSPSTGEREYRPEGA
jgi:hypothetical protein